MTCPVEVPRPIRRWWRLTLGVLILATGSGCMALLSATADAPSDLRPLEPGSMRFAVEAVLGEPLAEEYNRATYEFSRGTFFSPAEGDELMARAGRGAFWAFNSALHLFVVEPLTVVGGEGELKSRHGLITLVYGPDGRVIGRSYEAAQALYIAWKTQPHPDERLDLLCHAANAGHPSAQHAQAVRYQLGLFGTPVDLAEAYLWARLAAFGGDPRGARLQEHLAAELDPGQRAEIDTRYAHWTPEPCPDLQADVPRSIDRLGIQFGRHGRDSIDGGPGNDFLDGREGDDATTGWARTRLFLPQQRPAAGHRAVQRALAPYRQKLSSASKFSSNTLTHLGVPIAGPTSCEFAI